MPPATPCTITTPIPLVFPMDAPMMIPIGVARTKKMKKDRVVHLHKGWFYFMKVMPTVYATGILWTTIEAVRTAISFGSLNTPMANPSIRQ